MINWLSRKENTDLLLVAVQAGIGTIQVWNCTKKLQVQLYHT